MAVRPTTISRMGFIWIPIDYRLPNWTIQITRDDSTVDTVTGSLISGNVTLSATEEGGSSNLMLSNLEGQYTGLWDGGEKIEIWADFGSATQKIFRGILEEAKYSFGGDGHKLIVSGRDGSYDLMNVFINEEYTNQDAANIVNDIITNYASVVTYVLNLTGTIIEYIKFRDKTAWDAIAEVFKIAGHDFYVDTNLALQHFARDSQTCTTEYLVHGMNMLNCSFGTDLRDIFNRIKLVGANVDNTSNCLLLAMKEDISSQNSYYLKELILNRSDIEDMTQSEIAADQYLNENKNPTQKGTALGMGLPTLLPGYKLRISSPYENVNGYFRVIQLTHSISASSGFLTSVVVEKIKTKVSSYLADMYRKHDEGQDYSNINNMRYSYVIKFNEIPAIATFSNTQQFDGYLILLTGTSGTCVTNTYTADANFTKIEVRLAGQDYDVSTFEVSNDGGLTYTSCTLNTEYTLSSTGKNLKVRITLNSDANNPNPKIDTLAVLYR